MAPLVSVVIPAYNSERTVGAAIASALAQTVADLEVIVVDDGSSDQTACAARAAQDPRVQVIEQANGGAAAARNAGIRAARGTYVALLDADDLWLEHKLERQLAELRARPDVHAVQSGSFFVDDDLVVLSARRCEISTDALLDTLMFRNMPHNMGTLVIERAKFVEMGVFDTSLEILEEWDMQIKCARYCNLQSIPEPLALYRVHVGNRSRNLDIHIAPGLRVLERLFADPELPNSIRAQRRVVYARFYLMLAGGAFKVRRWRAFAYWVRRALASDPRTAGYIVAMPRRRLARRRSRTGRRV